MDSKNQIQKREIKFRGKVANKSFFDRLCSRAGFGDLKPADRSGDKPLQRQAVWYAMREQGVTFKEIAEQSHRDTWNGYCWCEAI